ncbi:MAG TPA: PfkB family carbohydrate kinase [Bryobacteraceae bacterium]|nr:PfkB family carbohydrate kinase [Bryobacteraceae bacterium]
MPARLDFADEGTALSGLEPVEQALPPGTARGVIAVRCYPRNFMPDFDVLGIGLNATDTLILVSHFPAYAGKVAFEDEILSPGGQVASAMATCARLGLRVKYIGTVGDDERARIQMDSLRETGIDLSDVEIREGCPNQTAYILIDQSTGERTVLWRRLDCLRLDPSSITPEKITRARLLHIDGHDTPAVARAAEIARKHSIPVTVDVDTIYHGFDRVLPNVDYLVASSEFPLQWTSERDPFKALELIQEEYKIPVAAMTLGAHGALARVGERFIYSPAFVVNCVDTTGAGDVFHGAFCYSVLQKMTIAEALEFSNAMAALNCTRIGARGGIATVEAARSLMERAERRPLKDFEQRVAGRAGS